ncbi:Histone-lysine N-methyltransferase EZH2 [Pleurostoma richardsiae]|uniref:Histone-lysine N-methyltransferase EZH2 n=1 Tax=Pleurostoma richardsiae TaxID=41990 RepID=A0AA38R0T1_9PEZI|nr:Histone-lysine N-methyltransferase EZH2 [Pleurostoma richardsiae]
MLKFVPHLRDLEKNEEVKYSRWIKELEAMDAQSGFKANSLDRPQKIAKTRQEETAAELSLYVERWIGKLGLENCSKSTLIRYMASQGEKDDKMTPQQKSSLLNSYSEDIGSPQAVKAAKLFTEAFDRVYKPLGVALSDVLLLDESVETIVDCRKLVKDGKVDNPGGEQLLEFVEYWLQSYTILGCLICYSHSCEHGEYDVDNQKRTFSVDTIGRFGNLLKKRRTRELWAKKQNPDGAGFKQCGPCKNQCYKNYDVGNLNAHVDPWTEDDTMLLRCLFASLAEGNIKPACAGAVLLGRRCWDVYRKLKELDLALPELDAKPEPPKIKPVNWYDRNRKMLMGDWQDMTVSHEHARREILDPCRHDGPCGPSAQCPCWKNGLLCERFCRCTAMTCPIKFTGCACHSSGKTCLQRKQEGRPCICVQLNRECDPVLCTGCGARERADPQNRNDEFLHATGCQNVALQRGQQKAVVLGKSQLEGCGYGLFTAQDIGQDDFVIEYKGELITHDEGVRREARRGDVFDEGSSSSYLFTLLEQEGIWVDAAIYGNLSRYINHASEHDKRGSNITPKILYVNGEFRIRFSALRDIRAGEELFFNYGENFPNLTQKLLDSKEADDDDDAAAPAPAAKGKGGRPRRQDGKPVARKTTARKKNGGARKEAPDLTEDIIDPATWDLDKFLDDEDGDPMYNPSGYKARRTRKRKRGGRGGARGVASTRDHEDDDTEDVEYRPGESQDDVDSGAVSEVVKKPRGRRPGRPPGGARRADTAVTAEDSDAPLPPLSTPRKRGRSARGSKAQPQQQQQQQQEEEEEEEEEEPEPDVESDEPIIQVPPPAPGSGGGGAGRKRKRVTDSEDEDEAALAAEDGDESESEYDSEDDDDDVVDRSRRKRQKPARYRSDG